MEAWEFDFEWLKTRTYVKEQLHQQELPDLNTILLLVGLQELGRWKKELSKEEKQDLMHIAVCRLLSMEGFFRFKGRDQDGWPHWEQLKPLPTKGVDEQEQLLKGLLINYFKGLRIEHEQLSLSKIKKSKHNEEE